jgi:hypothetical protein
MAMRFFVSLWSVVLSAVCAPADVFAQKPSQDVAVKSLAPLRLLEQRVKPPTARPQEFGLTGSNKPDGEIYRFRRGIPQNFPASIPRAIHLGKNDDEDDRKKRTLELADSTSDGWLCLYTSPMNVGSWVNQEYRVLLYQKDDTAYTVAWDIVLNPLFSRNDYLEVQDIRYEAGKLYCNEACITYSKDAKKQCSALLCIDPMRAKVLWRTPHLVSNNIFLLHGNVIICGYGFTAEDDYLIVLDKTTGQIRSKTPLDSQHQYMEMVGDVLCVITYKQFYRFEMLK